MINLDLIANCQLLWLIETFKSIFIKLKYPKNKRSSFSSICSFFRFIQMIIKLKDTIIFVILFYKNKKKKNRLFYNIYSGLKII